MQLTRRHHDALLRQAAAMSSIRLDRTVRVAGLYDTMKRPGLAHAATHAAIQRIRELGGLLPPARTGTGAAIVMTWLDDRLIIAPHSTDAGVRITFAFGTELSYAVDLGADAQSDAALVRSLPDFIRAAWRERGQRRSRRGEHRLASADARRRRDEENLKILNTGAVAWDEYRRLVAFVAAVAHIVESLPRSQQRRSARRWLRWARQHLRAVDPRYLPGACNDDGS